MSSMFSSNPRFAEGVNIINAVDEARFPLLMGRVAQGMQGISQGAPNSGQAFSSMEREKLQVSLGLEESNLTLLLESLNYILKQATFHVAKPATLREQLVGSGLTEEKASACAQVWATVAKATLDSMRQRSLYSKQLEDVKWTLGARLSSSAHTNQKKTVARLQLHVTSTEEEPSECINLDMTHGELFQFYRTLEDIQGHIDALN